MATEHPTCLHWQQKRRWAPLWLPLRRALLQAWPHSTRPPQPLQKPTHSGAGAGVLTLEDLGLDPETGAPHELAEGAEGVPPGIVVIDSLLHRGREIFWRECAARGSGLPADGPPPPGAVAYLGCERALSG